MRQAAVKAARQGVKATALLLDAVRPPAVGLVILAYHRVGSGSRLELDVEAPVFADQMGWLANEASPVTLDQGLERLRRPNQERAIVVTFDDGTADFIEHALPALVDHQVPATYYIATKFVDEQHPFPAGGTPMSWSGLAEAVSTGLVTVAAHTHSHAVMDKVSLSQAEEELRISADLIEDKLGVRAAHFAYPKGVFGGEAIESIVAQRYESAALVGGGPNLYGATNELRLRRSPIQASDGLRFFEQKVRGGLQLEGSLRERLNRRRYQDRLN
jgi:peptidoglycan/xylan/chitin deacetylase (PgdA/CDA1 family)